MKYVFYGTPNMLIKERKKQFYNGEIVLKPLFRFDVNGEFITEDEVLIKKLQSRFDHKPAGESKQARRVKKK